MHKPNKPSKPAFETRENYFSSVSFHIGHDRCQDGNQNQILRIVSSYILCIAQVNYIVLGGGWLVLEVDYSLTQEVIGEGYKSSDKLSLWVRWTGKVNHSYFCFKLWMLNVPLNKFSHRSLSAICRPSRHGQQHLTVWGESWKRISHKPKSFETF